MTIRPYTYLIITASLLVISLLTIALLPLSFENLTSSETLYHDVSGMEILEDHLWYTLNFEQQKQMISALNTDKVAPLANNVYPSAEKLKIYRFNGSHEVIDISPQH